MNSISYSCFPLKQLSLPHVYSILLPLALSHWRSFPEVWRGNCGSSIRGNEKCERGKTVGVEILRNDQPTWEHSWICQEQRPILGSKDMPFKLQRNVSLSHPENICGSANTSTRNVVFWNWFHHICVKLMNEIHVWFGIVGLKIQLQNWN